MSIYVFCFQHMPPDLCDVIKGIDDFFYSVGLAINLQFDYMPTLLGVGAAVIIGYLVATVVSTLLVSKESHSAGIVGFFILTIMVMVFSPSAFAHSLSMKFVVAMIFLAAQAGTQHATFALTGGIIAFLVYLTQGYDPESLNSIVGMIGVSLFLTMVFKAGMHNPPVFLVTVVICFALVLSHYEPVCGVIATLFRKIFPELIGIF